MLCSDKYISSAGSLVLKRLINMLVLHIVYISHTVGLDYTNI